MIIFENLSNVEVNFTTIIISLIYIGVIFAISFYRNQSYQNAFFNRNDFKIHPVLINYYSNGKITNDTIRIILLNLINKGYYKLEKINNDYKITWTNKTDYLDVKDLDLKNYEKDLIKLININLYSKKTPSILYSELTQKIQADIHLPQKINKIIDEIKYDITKEYGVVHYNTNYFLQFLASFFYYLIIFYTSKSIMFPILFSALILIISICLKNTTPNIKGIMGLIILVYTIIMIIVPLIPTIATTINPLITLLLIFNPLLILTSLNIIKVPFYTSKQKEIIEHINGFKNFLIDFTRLEHRPVDYINFVNEYYTLAEALNVKITNEKFVNTEYDDKLMSTLNAFEFNEQISEAITNMLYTRGSINIYNKKNHQKFRP